MSSDAPMTHKPEDTTSTAAERQAEDNIATQAEVTEALTRIRDSGIDSQETMLAPFTPVDFDDALKMAELISNSGVVAGNLAKNPGGCFAAMAYGAALGFHPIIAVQKLHVIPQKGGGNKVGMPADMMAAVCEADPEFEFFDVVYADDVEALVHAKKKSWGEPHPKAACECGCGGRQYKVTIQEAITAGYLDGKHSALWGKVDENGKEYPKGPPHRRRIMLAHMAVRESARLWNKKRMAGVYTPDELASGSGPVAITTASAAPSAAAIIGAPADKSAKDEPATTAEQSTLAEDPPEYTREQKTRWLNRQIDDGLAAKALNELFLKLGLIKKGETWGKFADTVAFPYAEVKALAGG